MNRRRFLGTAGIIAVGTLWEFGRRERRMHDSDLDDEGFPKRSFYADDPLRIIQHPKLEFRDQLDREPLHFEFVVGDRDSELPIKLTDVLRDWGKTRGSTVGCDCASMELSIGCRWASDDSNHIQCSGEWICDKCLPSLIAIVDERFPTITKIVVGRTQEDNPPRQGPFWIAVPARTLEFVNRGTIEVPEFMVSRYEVSVGEFHEFTKATGYVTSAEQRGDKTFRNHEAVAVLTQKSRLECAATEISWRDAKAYCEWKEIRLGTQSEHISSALTYLQLAQQLHDRKARFADVSQQFLAGDVVRWNRSWIENEGEGNSRFVFSSSEWVVESDKGSALHFRVRARRSIQHVRAVRGPLELMGDIMLGFAVVRPS